MYVVVLKSKMVVKMAIISNRKCSKWTCTWYSGRCMYCEKTVIQHLFFFKVYWKHCQYICPGCTGLINSSLISTVFLLILNLARFQNQVFEDEFYKLSILKFGGNEFYKLSILEFGGNRTKVLSRVTIDCSEEAFLRKVLQLKY